MKIRCPWCQEVVNVSAACKNEVEGIQGYTDKHYVSAECWEQSLMGPIPQQPMRMLCIGSHSALRK